MKSEASCERNCFVWHYFRSRRFEIIFKIVKLVIRDFACAYLNVPVLVFGQCLAFIDTGGGPGVSLPLPVETLHPLRRNLPCSVEPGVGLS